MARIFDTHLSFDHALAQVAQDAERSRSLPPVSPRAAALSTRLLPSRCQSRTNAAVPVIDTGIPARYPSQDFFGLKPASYLMPAKLRSNKISPCIRQPDRRQRSQHPPHPIWQRAKRNHISAQPANIYDRCSSRREIASSLITAALVGDQVIGQPDQQSRSKGCLLSLDTPLCQRFRRRSPAVAATANRSHGCSPLALNNPNIFIRCKSKNQRNQRAVHPAANNRSPPTQWVAESAVTRTRLDNVSELAAFCG